MPIATTIKSVPICLSTRRWDQAGSAQLCKRGLRADALRVITGEDQHVCGRACPYPLRLDHLRRERRGQCIEVCVMTLDLLMKRQLTPGNRAQADLGRDGR
jgi:hypothetical protein